MYILKQIEHILTREQSDFLRAFFKNCPENISSGFMLKSYPASCKLIRTDDLCTSVYVLLKGKLQAVEERASESNFLFTELTAVDIAGDFELFSETSSRLITLTTLEECLCLVIPASSYLSWIKTDPNALFIRLQMLIRQMTLQTTTERRNHFLDNKTRLLQLIMQNYQEAGSPDLFRFDKTRENISEHIGCSTRTVNRAVLRLKEDGYLSTDRGKIYISREQADMINDFLSKPDV